MNYHYQAYGFNFSSELKIDEMIPGGDGKDIKIKTGITPKTIENPVYTGKLVIISNNQALITVKDIAKFFISEGKLIVIEKIETASFEEVKLYLLGIILGIIMHQRNELILHANVLNINDYAVLLAGNSGAGKSTFTALMLEKGLYLVSDDIALIRFDDKNNPWVYPGFPRIKLHIDSIKSLNIDKNKIVQLHQKIEKYNVPVTDKFYNKSLSVKKLFIIEPGKDKQFSISDIEGFNKFQYIKDYIYLKFFTNLIWEQDQLFNLQTKLAAKVKLAVLSNPKNWITNKDLIEKVINSI